MNNIIKHELKTGFKPFIFWALGLAFLVFAGMTKFLGFGGPSGADITVLLDQFPKIFLVMFGMANVDVQSLGGYFSVLQFYALVCVSIYAIHLGTNAVSREAVDKTYEFIFTKPRTRSYILSCKLLAGVLYLIAFCALNLIFSFLALPMLGINNTIQTTIVLYALASFFEGLVFFSLAAMLSTLFTRAELGIKVSNTIFIIAYILSILFDLSENTAVIRPFTPLKYYEAASLIGGKFDILYTAVCLVISAAALFWAFHAFNKRDLNAI